jgi:hypothetical protein
LAKALYLDVVQIREYTMALAGSVVAVMKPAISNADNAIESFMLFSLKSEAPDNPGTHRNFDAASQGQSRVPL